MTTNDNGKYLGRWHKPERWSGIARSGLMKMFEWYGVVSA